MRAHTNAHARTYMHTRERSHTQTHTRIHTHACIHADALQGEAMPCDQEQDVQLCHRLKAIDQTQVGRAIVTPAHTYSAALTRHQPILT